MELLKHVAKHHQNDLSDSNEEKKSVGPVEKDVGIDKKEGQKMLVKNQVFVFGKGAMTGGKDL